MKVKSSDLRPDLVHVNLRWKHQKIDEVWQVRLATLHYSTGSLRRIFRCWSPQFHACRVTLGLLPVSLASGLPLFDRSVAEPPEPFRVTSALWIFQLSSV